MVCIHVAGTGKPAGQHRAMESMRWSFVFLFLLFQRSLPLVPRNALRIRSTEANNPAAAAVQLEDSLYNANECIRMLLHEPSMLMESKICAQARINANTLKALLGIKE